MTASLYIHIPFCAGKCDYCDFFSVPVNESKDSGLLDRFAGAVVDDIKDQIDIFGVDHVPAIYIGGGTPSALGAKRMEHLLTGLQAVLKSMQKPPAEFTVEANPESADENFLQACRSGGVSRISLGVQSFHEPSRRAVHRKGDSHLLERRLALAAQLFPGAFSADLITGLPFQTAAILESDIRTLLSYQPAHVSLYSLTLEPQTPLGRQTAQQGAAAISLPSGEEADSLWIHGRDLLEASGFTQYEVSNFSLGGKHCIHNIRYWQMENWLGAGPAASGTLIDENTGTGRRLSYPGDIGGYLAAPKPRIHTVRAEELSRSDLVRESLLMGFRYRGGPNAELFRRRFHRSIEEYIPNTIARWHERGFFETGEMNAPAALAPSQEGLLFLNSFLRDAFSELEGNYPCR